MDEIFFLKNPRKLKKVPKKRKGFNSQKPLPEYVPGRVSRR